MVVESSTYPSELHKAVLSPSTAGSLEGLTVHEEGPFVFNRLVWSTLKRLTTGPVVSTGEMLSWVVKLRDAPGT